MKFSLSEYTIDKEYDAKLRKRIETFRKNTGTKKSVQIVFVTTYIPVELSHCATALAGRRAAT